MNRNLRLLALSVGAILPLAAGAQEPMTPTTESDKQFLIKDAQGSAADLATAEVGIMKANAPEVEQYAIRVAYDHDRLNMELLQMAHERGLTLPVTMSGDDQKTLNDLKTKSGHDFDLAYLQGEVKTNAQDVQDANAELAATTDPKVQAFVSIYRDTETQHLTMAQTLLTQMATGK